jgi:tetratricopeptide (TPR) repeat protein
MHILKRVDTGQRLETNDIVWLSTVAEEYFTDELRIAHHRLEAAFFASEFLKTHDPWAAINASRHYRKCGCTDDAQALLNLINVEKQSLKIQAAIYTTYGGVMRDLNKWDEAQHLGERAHTLQPKDYRPCILLGQFTWKQISTTLGKCGTIKQSNEVRSLMMLIGIFARSSPDLLLLGEENWQISYSK